MRSLPGFALSIVGLLAACGGGDGATSDIDASPGSVDAPPGESPDAAPGDDPDAAPGDHPDAAPETPVCGTAMADVSRIRGTEGLAIGPDGTIYFSQMGGVGRLRPGEAVEPDWAAVANPAGGTVYGLALTSAHLYVAYRTGESIWRFDRSTGQGAEWLTDAGEPNGMIIGADGALYYSDFGAGRVHRVDLATKARTTVTTSRIVTANGLYAVDATHLLVLAYNAADVVELTLQGGVEVSRRVVADLDEAANIRLDGITRDTRGRWYLTDNRNGAVIRRPSDFAAPPGNVEEILATGSLSFPANLAFGRGALSCNDLYVTSAALMQRITVQ